VQVDDALETRLAEACAAAARAWPAVVVPPEELAAALGARAEPDRPLPRDEAAVELHLALGCARGDAAALAAFERDFLSAVGPALASMALPAATVDEVRQEVRRKLLVREPGREGPPRVVEYAGDGTLRGLVAVVAARTALDGLRRARREAPAGDGGDDDLLDLPAASADPRQQVIKAELRASFKKAFATAATGLEARDRNLLRLHYLDGLTLEQLASMYGVHRATVVRWIADVRGKLLSATRKGLRAEAGIGEAELDSVMALIESGLDVSVRRLFGSAERSGGSPTSR